MAKRTLNDRIIRALKPAKPGKRVEIFDSLVPGLSVRTTDAGVKSFTLATRYPGHKHPARRTIGRYGEGSLEQASNTAREWLPLVARGIDPAVEIERQRLAEQRKHAASFAAVEKISLAINSPENARVQRLHAISSVSSSRSWAGARSPRSPRATSSRLSSR